MKIKIKHSYYGEFNQAFQPYAKELLFDLADSLELQPKIKDHEMWLLNPARHDKAVGSFSVHLETGKWNDFASSDEGHDFISFIKHLTQKDPNDIISEFTSKLNSDPLNGAKKALDIESKSTIENFIPVSETAPLRPDVHSDLGKPTATWCYQNSNGQIAFYVYRFEVPGGKQFRPLSFNGAKWVWKSWPGQRPLLNGHLLKKYPNRSTIVVEGEKACDTASQMFPRHVCVTSAGGSSAPKKTNWAPLHQRAITVIPDNDAPGRKYRDWIIQHLQDDCDIEIVDTTTLGWSEGDDLADHPMEPGEAAVWLEEHAVSLDALGILDVDGESAGDRLVGLVTAGIRKNEMELFRDADDLYLATLKLVYQNFLLDSAKTHEILNHLFFSHFKKGLTETALKNALATLKAIARFNGRDKKVYRRVARPNDDSLIIDLGTDDWSVIRIASGGWRHKKHSAVPFTRYERQAALPIPAPSEEGTVEVLRDFTNVSNEDFPLAIGTILAAFSGKPPFPIAAVTGLFGSGKSTLSMVFKRLIDPSVDLLSSAPETPVDLYSIIHSTWFSAFDNISTITPAMSDAFCRASTGGHAARRRYFTTFDKCSIDISRPLLLNCITNPIRRPDLLSRTIFLRTATLPRYKKDLESEFCSVWPIAFSGILNALVAGLKYQDQTSGMDDHRLMDCFHWITACEHGLPWSPGTFYERFMEQTKQKDEDVLDDSLVGGLLVEYMADKTEWRGNATELLKILREMPSAAPVLRDPEFPSNPSWLIRKLNEIIPNLKSIGLFVNTNIRGVYINYKDEKKKERYIHVAWDNSRNKPSEDNPSAKNLSVDNSTESARSVSNVATVKNAVTGVTSPESLAINGLEAGDGTVTAKKMVSPETQTGDGKKNGVTVVSPPQSDASHGLQRGDGKNGNFISYNPEIAPRSLCPEITYEVITDEETAHNTLQYLTSSFSILGLDIETQRNVGYLEDKKAGLYPSKSRIRLIQLYTGKEGFIFDLNNINIKIFKPLSKVPCIAHNALFESMFFQAVGIELKLGCTMLMHAVLTNQGRISFKQAAQEYLNIDLSKEQQTSDWNTPELSKQQLDYAMLDAVLALQLHKVLHQRLADEKLLAGYQLARNCINPVAKAQITGFPFDSIKHTEKISEWQKDQLKAENALRKLCGDINFNSQKQLSQWLETKLPKEILGRWSKSPKSGYLTTGAAELARHEDVDIVQPLIAYKRMEKQLSTYGEGYLKHVINHRIYPSFTLLGAASGRMTCSQPNIQQLPNRYGLRECVRALGDSCILAADYSQIELRIVAILAQDHTMLDAYRQGHDLHTLMAGRILKKDQGDISTDDRKIAKAANFGLLYGAGPTTLQTYARVAYGVELTEEEAIHIREVFRQTYPGIYRWQQETTAQTQQSLMTRTIGGRIRRYRPDEKGLYCESLNTPVQGAGADLLMGAIPKVAQSIKGYAAEMIGFVHDEIIVGTKETEADTVQKAVENAMREAFVELFPETTWMAQDIVTMSVGNSYAEVK